jgi:endonuclease/exonuclease/phosphatase family metal-dependent hydrolase
VVVRSRLAVVVLGALGLLGGLGLTAAPASATQRIAITAVGGDAQITAAWPVVAGATGYVVHWGTGRATNHARSTTATSIRIGRLRNRSTYSVRVDAVGVAAASARTSVRAVPYVPTSLRWVHAVSAGPDQIRVSWAGGGQARSVAVVAGADSMMTTHRFSTAWLPAAVRSTILTVPASLRGTLGAGSGNVVFVKVVLSNSTAANPAKLLRFSAAARYRLSPSGTWALAGAAPADGASTRLKVASWNVQSITASAGFASKDRWAERLPRVAANIEDVRPDLIGLQELTTARVLPSCLNPAGSFPCQEQYQTLQTALQSADVPYRNVRTDANAWVYAQPAAAYVDSALFYDPATLQVEQSGFVSPRTLLGSAWPRGLTDEAGMWARFRTIDPTGGKEREFLAVSMHLPAGNEAAVRSAEAAAVASFMDAKALQPDGTRLPNVFVGDFNDNGALTAGAGSLRLLADHYVDTAATTQRTGMRYSTSNGTNGSDGVDPGYPVRAVAHPYPTSRIDYVMVKDSPHLFGYQNLVRLTADQRFMTAFQGSDHNMQVADLGIGDPVAG